MKKVLSLVLVLALVLGSFSMAFAAEPTTKTTNMSDVAGNANEGAIIVANDLGIVTGYNDGTFKPANAVTRAEFAAMMTRALAIPESALKGFKTSSFGDVASDHWAVTYLGYCNSKGIMTGYEDGSARPNQTITVNEAMTMICRALGYTAQAKELVGSWPANYIALAQQLSLYDDVAATATTDRASAAQIIYNSLTVPVKYIDADGVTRVLTDGDGAAVTMLGSLGGDEIRGGDPFVLLYTDAYDAKIDIQKYVGCAVKAWTDSDHDIIAVEEVSTSIRGKVKSDDTFLGDDGVEYRYSSGDRTVAGTFSNAVIGLTAARTTAAAVAHSTLLFKNGNQDMTTNASGIVTESATGLGDLSAYDGKKITIAAKIDGKTIKQIYSVIKWGAEAQDMFEASDLDLDKAEIVVNGVTGKFPTNKNNEINYDKFELLGATSVDKIAEDNVVEIFRKGSTITRLTVGTKTVTGTITKINKDGDTFWIDGVEYAESDNRTDAIELGDEGTAYLNYDGDIAFWDVTASTAGNYAIYLGAGNDSTITTNTSKVALYTKADKEEEFVMASGYTVNTASVQAAAANKIGTNCAFIVNYSLNSSNKVNKNITTMPTTRCGVTATGAVNQSYTTFDNKELAKNVIVFFVDGTDWSVGSVKDLKVKDTGVAYDASYILDKKAEKIEVLVVNKAQAVKSDDKYGFINALASVTKGDDKKWFVEGVVDGAELAAATDIDYDPSNPIAGPSYPDNPSNSLYKIVMDGTGVITDVTVHGIGTTVSTTTVKAISGNDITVANGNHYEVATDAVVYFYDADKEEFVVNSGLSKIGQKNYIQLFASDSDNAAKGLYDIVVFWK